MPCEQVPIGVPFSADRQHKTFRVTVRALGFDPEVQDQTPVQIPVAGRLDWFWEWQSTGVEPSPGFCKDPVCAPSNRILLNHNYVVEQHVYDLSGTHTYGNFTNAGRLDLAGDLVSAPGRGFQFDLPEIDFSLFYDDPTEHIRGPYLGVAASTIGSFINDPVCLKSASHLAGPGCFLKRGDSVLPSEVGAVAGRLRSALQTRTPPATRRFTRPPW